MNQLNLTSSAQELIGAGMKQIKRKVYIINKGTHDYSEAEKFGELVFLTEGNYHILSTSKMAREMIYGLKFSTPDDYIMPCSLTVMSSIACGIYARMHKRLNLLIYTVKRGRGEYKARTLNFEEV